MPVAVIDWKLAIKRAGNSREFAEKMLKMVVNNLPDEFLDIKMAYESSDYVQLKRHLHKLHGALCYCGAPKLSAAATAFEAALEKNSLSELSVPFIQFELAVMELINEAACFST